MSQKISACIICFNEEAKIRGCLESVKWCDEIVVVDSFSTDSTVAICREYTDQIHQHEWLGYIGQRNLILGMANHPWVLFLDADEEISVPLRDEILAAFKQGVGSYKGYRFPRQVLYMDQWITHGAWYPDIKLRLFQKEYGKSTGQEPHDHVVVDGAIKTLKHPILHYTYDNLQDHLNQVNRFSSIAARVKYDQGGRFSWLDFIFRPSWRFIKGYFIRGGYREGFRGFLIAAIASFEVRMKYAKLKEYQLMQGCKKDEAKG